jgi:hypothetical protein
MAYSRYRRKTRRTYRKSGPKRRSSARPSRYTGRTRRYTRRRPMSKRSVLNTTSHKKRNGMLSWSNTTTSGTFKNLSPGAAYIVGSSPALFVWSPTMMNLDSTSLMRNPASRTSHTCYMKGLSEHVRIQTSNGVPWFHRRICFTMKGNNAFNTSIASDPNPTEPNIAYVDTSNGIERLLRNQFVNNVPLTVTAQYSILFKGVQNVDWDDPLIAPVDTSRVSLKFDKTWKLQSGNERGVVRERKLWHPMNKNLTYDDDENGETEVGSYFSTTSKEGMGDYYVIDYITAGVGGTSSDYMYFNCNSTMYWHEK